MIPITVTFSKPVAVFGTPTLALNSGGGAVGNLRQRLGDEHHHIQLHHCDGTAHIETGLLGHGVTRGFSGGFIYDLVGNTGTLTLPGTGTANDGVAAQNITISPASIFSGLTASSTITYGTATTTLGGTILSGSNVPNGNVTISVNGTPYTAAINPSTGAFSASIDTHALPVTGSPYTITYSYAGNSNFNAASDVTRTLTINPLAITATITLRWQGLRRHQHGDDDSYAEWCFEQRRRKCCQWHINLRRQGRGHMDRD